MDDGTANYRSYVGNVSATRELMVEDPPPAPAGTAVAPLRQSSWQGTSWLMLTDIVGTSVLTFAGVARQLGWVLTVVLILGGCPVSIYTASLMSRTRILLASDKREEPLTMGEAARITLGGKRAADIVYLLVYGLGFLGNSAYLLTLGQALQGTFYTWSPCLPGMVMWAGIAVLPLCIAVRHLADSIWLCFVNLFLIMGVLGIVMVEMARAGRVEGAQTFMVAEDLTFLSLFGACTNIVYSFTGHWLYFELMAEMKEPSQFMRVFTFNAPCQIGLYLLVACWGYYYAGDQAKGYFLDNLELGTPFRVASALLFLHVVIAFLLKNVVLTRYVHQCLSPKRAKLTVGDVGGWRAHAEYAACAVGLVGSAFLVANAVPFFDDLLGLIGGLLSGPISFFLPMMFFAGARALVLRSRLARAPPSTGDGREPLAAGIYTEAVGGPVVEKEALGKEWTVPLADEILFTLVGSFILLTMFVGTYSVVGDIVKRTEAAGLPFSCKLLTRK